MKFRTINSSPGLKEEEKVACVPFYICLKVQLWASYKPTNKIKNNKKKTPKTSFTRM